MKCNDNYGNHECWVMKTIAAKREHYFPLFWTSVFHVIFPISQAHKMKGSQIKCTVFLGQFYVRSFQKRMQGICLLVRTYRKFFFFFMVHFVRLHWFLQHIWHSWANAHGWFSRSVEWHIAASVNWEKRRIVREGERERGKERENMKYFCSCLLA